MSTTTIRSPISPAEQRITLRNVSWTTYERLSADLAGQSSPRLTFNQGLLEITSPLPEHEKYNRRLALLIEIVAEELGVEIEDLGSTTFRRPDLARGFEADSCFYIQHVDDISNRDQIDLAVAPPPDLVVEIDITSDSQVKLPVYSAMGVPEVWRYDGEQLIIYLLKNGHYEIVAASLSFPILTSAVLTQFLSETKTLKRRVLVNRVREWLTARIQQSHQQ